MTRKLEIIVLLSFISFVPFIGSVHLFDWDEINFAESSREMLVTGNYTQVMINYQPFWEKPPFFFWLQALSMKIFGVNEFAARLPNAIAGILTMLLLFYTGKRIKDENFGFLWSLLYGSGILPFIYFKSGIIDPWFNLFIFASFICVYFSFKVLNDFRWLVASGIFMGLAIITKGPVAFLILFLSFLIISLINKNFRLFVKKIIILSFIAFVVSFLWYGYELYENGFWFIREFIIYQAQLFTQPVAGHEQPLYFHWLVVFFGCFPFSIFAIQSFKKKFFFQDDFRLWAIVLFMVVMILFTIVKTKIIHYSSLSYLPLSYLALISLKHYYVQYPNRVIRIVYFSLGFIVTLIFLIVPVIFMKPDLVSNLLKDDFARECLYYDVNWNVLSFVPFLIALFFLLVNFVLLKKLKVNTFIILSFVGTSLTLNAFYFLNLSKIERHIQGSMIEYYKGLSDKNVYVYPYGFKSYAQYFYFKVKPDDSPINMKFDLLMEQNIKPVFIITKYGKSPELEKDERFYKIRKDGGFILWKKK